jgi:hypothetical protein
VLVKKCSESELAFFISTAKESLGAQLMRSQSQWVRSLFATERATSAVAAAAEATKKKDFRVEVLDFYCLIRGRPCGIRTCDQRIKSPLLYQLS